MEGKDTPSKKIKYDLDSNDAKSSVKKTKSKYDIDSDEDSADNDKSKYKSVSVVDDKIGEKSVEDD